MRSRGGRQAGNTIGEGQHSSRSAGNLEQLPSSKLGAELVGKRVKVWWPDDQQFYLGIIKHYNPKQNKHTVFYDDGEVERLILEKEIWEETDIPPEAPDSVDITADDPDISQNTLYEPGVESCKQQSKGPARHKGKGGQQASSLSRASSKGGGSKGKGQGCGGNGSMKRARSADSAASPGLMSASAEPPRVDEKLITSTEGALTRPATSTSGRPPPLTGNATKKPRRPSSPAAWDGQLGPGDKAHGGTLDTRQGGVAREVQLSGQDKSSAEGEGTQAGTERSAALNEGERRGNGKLGNTGRQAKSPRGAVNSPRPPKAHSNSSAPVRPKETQPATSSVPSPPLEYCPTHNPSSIFPAEAMAAIMSPAHPSQDLSTAEDRIGAELLSMVDQDPLPDPLNQDLSESPAYAVQPAGGSTVIRKPTRVIPPKRVKIDQAPTPKDGVALNVDPVDVEAAAGRENLCVEVFCNGVRGLYMAGLNIIECRCSGCRPLLPEQKRFIPRVFEQHAGMAAAKKWRFSIKLWKANGTSGIPLGKWLEDTGIEVKQPGRRNVLPSPAMASVKAKLSVPPTPGRSCAPSAARPPRSPYPGHQATFKDPLSSLSVSAPVVSPSSNAPAGLAPGDEPPSLDQLLHELQEGSQASLCARQPLTTNVAGFPQPDPSRVSRPPHESAAPTQPGFQMNAPNGQTTSTALTGINALNREILSVRQDCGTLCLEGDGFQVRRLLDPPVFEIWSTSFLGFGFDEVTIRCEESGQLSITAEPSELKWAELWAMQPVKMIIPLPERVRPETAQSVITATGHLYMRVRTVG